MWVELRIANLESAGMKQIRDSPIRKLIEDDKYEKFNRCDPYL